MTDSEADSDAHANSRGTDDGVEWGSPLAAGLLLWREAALATVGVLAFAAGMHGWLYVLGGSDGWGYTTLNLLGDLAYVAAGMFLLLAAAGSAAVRVRRA